MAGLVAACTVEAVRVILTLPLTFTLTLTPNLVPARYCYYDV